MKERRPDAPAPRLLTDEDGQLGDAGIDQSARDRRECDPSDDPPRHVDTHVPMVGKMSGIPALPGGHHGLEAGVAGVQTVLIDLQNLLGVRGSHRPDDGALRGGRIDGWHDHSSTLPS
jgi:hypothetical protein